MQNPKQSELFRELFGCILVLVAYTWAVKECRFRISRNPYTFPNSLNSRYIHNYLPVTALPTIIMVISERMFDCRWIKEVGETKRLDIFNARAYLANYYRPVLSICKHM
jgi:hypothetical protein